MINRRSLLKALLAAPALSMPSWSSSAPEPASGNDFYILLQGLMFMELNTDKGVDTLVVKVPVISGHSLYCGVSASSALPCDITCIDWTSTGLPHNAHSSNFSSSCTIATSPSDIPQDIPQSMLQFSRSDTGVGDPNQAKYTAYTLTFPWPNHFYAIRSNDLPPFDTDFPVKLQVKVKDAIKRCCPSQVGVISVLHYVSGPVVPPCPAGSQPVSKYHYFFQDPSGSGDINSHLKEAKNIFQNPRNFDLTVDMSGGVLQSAPLVDPGLPGLDETDEYAYLECHQLSAIVSLYLREQKAKRKAKKSGKKDDREAAKILATKLNDEIHHFASSANCPNFYVG